ncbi:hypothetical protein HPP92_014710 [Vanilla planifolia]|uniref:DNA mismatch repair proteins mutS family domain-containing protein n=1 Tax=Vanilla planifolia TaxID=51239 RepID=A0A835QLY8_VANPL|nr:hypothetical protein HPP92_014710 [Vanilla planifolia]
MALLKRLLSQSFVHANATICFFTLLLGIILQVREIYGLDEDVYFRNVTFSSEKRPKPIYLGAATQVGVIQTEGIPSLLKVLLPSSYGGLPTLYVRDLLLNPPPYEISSAIQEACRSMQCLKCSIPGFTCVSSSKLVKLLESKEVNHIEFCKIMNVVDEILQMHKSPELSTILRILLEPTWLATGLKVDYDTLVEKCSSVSQRIGEMIFLGGEREQETSSFSYIPSDFFSDLESSWKCRVKKIHAEMVFEDVDKAAEALHIAVMEDFVPIVQRVKSIMSPLGGSKGEICYAREHEAVWFKGKRFMPSVWANTIGEEQIKQLRPAIDSKRRRVGEEWYTTVKVEDALLRYHQACAKAKSKVLELLRELATEMQANINIIVFSSMLLVIAKALSGHVSEGLRRKWVFPDLIEGYKHEVDCLAEVSNYIEFIGLSPYWFHPSQGNAIRNNVKMQSIFLLTGPNGGGKSSLLRSVCAAALLGICGLMVPAESAIIPHFDSIMLHMKAYDSPADGKSSFQIEMSELRTVVSSATKRSLVLVDEICRGTETAKGTCIAGSIVEKLDDIGCLGIVSTHLHGIIDLPLCTKNVICKQMGTEVVDGHVKPTWELHDGICRESLAFETAQKEGLPESIIKRAEELYLSSAISKPDQDCVEAYDSLIITSTSNLYGSLKELQNAVESTVTMICKRKLIEYYKYKGIVEFPDLVCRHIGAREQPPPSTVGTSCVYVLFRPDKKLYIGQSDDLLGRVHSHRAKDGMLNAEFLYVVVPGKSIAGELETLLINQLPNHGFRIVNKADGRHCNFGTSSLSQPSLTMHN